MSHRFRGLALGLLAMLAVAPAAQAATHHAGAKPKPKPVTGYYLSLGDSYAVGVEDPQVPTLLGYPNQLVKLAAARGWKLTLVNFGCGGATTTSMLSTNGCPPGAQAPGAPDAAAPTYPSEPQIQAALDFIKAHPHQVKVVSVSIGGNDVDRCPTAMDPNGCVHTNMGPATANLTKMVKELRAAGGADMRIIGSTYPDVELGLWVNPTILGPSTLTVMAGSLTAFTVDVNPGLKKAYDAAGAAFVDVTTATGAFGPFVTTMDPTYGQIPVPVAMVCKYTYFCKDFDIHMTTAGYSIIARLEAATLPKL
jgi:lysophospholipase L1-like esterase